MSARRVRPARAWSWRSACRRLPGGVSSVTHGTQPAPHASSLRLRDGPDHAPCRITPRVAEVTSQSNGEPLVRLSGVNKWFGELHVLQDIDLEIARGEVVVVIGPSGSGKSTLCRTINRLESIEQGDIAIDGQLLPAEGKQLARLRSEVG